MREVGITPPFILSPISRLAPFGSYFRLSDPPPHKQPLWVQPWFNRSHFSKPLFDHSSNMRQQYEIRLQSPTHPKNEDMQRRSDRFATGYYMQTSSVTIMLYHLSPLCYSTWDVWNPEEPYAVLEEEDWLHFLSVNCLGLNCPNSCSVNSHNQGR